MPYSAQKPTDQPAQEQTCQENGKQHTYENIHEF
jgi:hypothetical protein